MTDDAEQTTSGPLKAAAGQPWTVRRQAELEDDKAWTCST